ncbi:MAG: Crp/Fnr family transcriptional regulator [Deltaproteobacteria bacterium]|nr:MAG: Crp/Fnr family transcriptional regulator [Deltaproteobacteria bacterium]
MNIFPFLQSNTLGRDMSEKHLRKLADAAVKKNYRAGQSIINENDIAKAFYVVISGMVKMFKASPEGREQTLYIFGPGEMFGICAIFSDMVFPAGASALEDSVILTFQGDLVQDIARQDPTILFNMIRVLACRLKESMALVELLALKDIPQRVASFILLSNMKKNCGVEDVVDLMITRREMAKIIGSTPETLSRVLKKMATKSMIEIEGRRLRVLNHDALDEISRASVIY